MAQIQRRDRHGVTWRGTKGIDFFTGLYSILRTVVVEKIVFQFNQSFSYRSL